MLNSQTNMSNQNIYKLSIYSNSSSSKVYSIISYSNKKKRFPYLYNLFIVFSSLLAYFIVLSSVIYLYIR